MTDDIRAIEARHTQDDVWFRAGHHDPNGYVAMAHKDRGALLDKMRPIVEAQHEAAGHPSFEAMVIPKAAWDWLMGIGPDDRGHHFGDSPEAGPGQPRLWWRTTFNRMCGEKS